MKDSDSLRKRVGFLVLSCVACLVCPDLYAQSPSDDLDRLQEIIVTAKRRSQDIQTTSISATVLTQELLEDKGVVDLFALQYAAPAVTVTQYGSANVFNIRGLGRSQVDIDVPSGVVIYRDGAPTLAGYFQNEPYFDMESVEVFRGPQGTFVGKSAAGGAVFINTADPQLADTTGSVQAGFGNHEAFEATAILNVPASDTTAFRFGYHHSQRGHFYDSITGNYTGDPGEVDNHSFRVGALWQPRENLTSVLKVDYHDLDFGGNVTTVFGEEPLGNVVQNANFEYTDESMRAVLDIKYRFANGTTLSSLSGYQDVESVNNLDLNATLPVIYIFNSRIDAQIYSQEINLISPDDQRFRWVLGAFWQEQDAVLPSWEEGGFNFIGNGFPLTFPWATSPWDNWEEDIAAFGHVGYRFTDQVELEAGVRYSEYKREQFTEWIFDDGATPPDTPWPGTTPGGDRQSMSEDSVDWQVALNWNATDKHYLYGLVSRGHITGGINIFPPFILYPEMEVINYETGWKGTWLGDRLNTQFTIYYESFKDYQANFAEVVGLITFPTNRTAETESHLWGIELSGQARHDRLSLDFGLAFLESELGTFSDVQDPFRSPLDNDGNGVPDNVVNLSGAKSPFSPEFTGNIGLAYDFRFNGYTLTPRADVSHIAETQGALWDSPMVTLPERTLVNAQVTLGPASGKWLAVLWGTNVTDKHYIGGIQNNATLFYAAPPAQYGLRVRYSF